MVNTVIHSHHSGTVIRFPLSPPSPLHIFLPAKFLSPLPSLLRTYFCRVSGYGDEWRHRQTTGLLQLSGDSFPQTAVSYFFMYLSRRPVNSSTVFCIQHWFHCWVLVNVWQRARDCSLAGCREGITSGLLTADLLCTGYPSVSSLIISLLTYIKQKFL